MMTRCNAHDAKMNAMHDTQAKTTQQQRITGRHLAHRSQGATRNIQGSQKPDILFRDPSIGEMPIELIPSDEVEPCFRTPCNTRLIPSRAASKYSLSTVSYGWRA